MKHHNHDYTGGSPNIPIAVGDRYYAQDLGRDFNFLRDLAGKVILDVTGKLPVLFSGGGVSQGSGDTLDIASGVGYADHGIDVPDDSTVIPATVTQENIPIRIEWGGQNDLSIPDATLDGSTPNYVKLTYAESVSADRTRAKASGSYPVEKSPSFVISVSSTLPTSTEVCLASFIGSSGGAFTFSQYPSHRYAGNYPIGTTAMVTRIEERPSALGLTGVWTDVTSSYGDRVPRTAGALAGSAFSLQEDAMQRITGYTSYNATANGGSIAQGGAFQHSSPYVSPAGGNQYVGGNPNMAPPDYHIFDSAYSFSPNPAKTDLVETRVKSFVVEYWRRTA